MRIPGKLLLAALTAAIALAITAGTASAARSFSVNPTTLRATSLTPIPFTEEGGARIQCDVTLNGSLHRLIAKVSGTLAGYVTEGRAQNCRGDARITTTVLASPARPWHARFVSFTGTLPRITEVRLVILEVGFLFRVQDPIFGTRIQECLYGGHIEVNARVRQPESTIERVDILAGQVAPLVRALEQAGRACARRGSLEGSFRLTPLVTIRLH